MSICPECGSNDVNVEENYRMSDQFSTLLELSCNNCGCEWVETEEITIAKHGDKHE